MGVGCNNAITDLRHFLRPQGRMLSHFDGTTFLSPVKNLVALYPPQRMATNVLLQTQSVGGGTEFAERHLLRAASDWHSPSNRGLRV